MENTMINTDDRKNVDLLVNQFWKLGYFTISRRYGTFLPEPSKVGRFDVDIIGKQKKRYAIGITVTEKDLNNGNLREKLEYLATRHTKFSNEPVMLIVGVPISLYKHVKNLLNQIVPEIRKNIKLMQILDKSIESNKISGRKSKVLFS
jgi:hypothetical protein